jgi:hypothetical protein
MGEGHLPLSQGEGLCEGGIARVGSKFGFNSGQLVACRAGFQDARASEDDDRGSNALILLNELGFEEFQSQPEGAQLIPLQEGEVPVGGNIGTGSHDRIRERVLVGLRVNHGARL